MGETIITLSGDGVKHLQDLDITISVTATINVDPQTARRAVQGWLVDDVGNMLLAHPPQLIIGKQTVWRVPVFITSTFRGVLGYVGTVDVDADTGAMLINDEFTSEIVHHAQSLARTSKSSAA